MATESGRESSEASGTADGAPHASTDSACAPGRPPGFRCRAAVYYALRDDLRYLSHHDELRMLTRALIRARWPLAWSEGFNPQPRVNVVLPRRVGTASDCQLAIVELAAAENGDVLLSRLRETLPQGCDATHVDSTIGPGTPHAVRAVYSVDLDADEARAIAAVLESVLARGTLEVVRESGPARPARRIDIRPFVEAVWMDGNALYMRLGFDGQLSARPSEVTTCMGLTPERTEHRVRRVEVRWDKTWTAAPQSAGVRERNTLGEEENGAFGDDAHSAKDRGKED